MRWCSDPPSGVAPPLPVRRTTMGSSVRSSRPGGCPCPGGPAVHGRLPAFGGRQRKPPPAAEPCAGMLATISRALEERDQTQGHGDRVAALADPVARRLGWGPGRLAALRFGAPLHDIGKVSVRAHVL